MAASALDRRDHHTAKAGAVDIRGHMLHQRLRRDASVHRGWRNVAIAAAALLIAGPARAQTSSASRPLSATVISTYVARDGELTLLVLWRGSPGWYSRGEGHSSSSGGGGQPGHEVGSVSLTYGGRTLSIDFDYSAGRARLLDQEILLADTNVVLVDDVDAPSGAQIVGRRRVVPTLPQGSSPALRTIDDDPAVTAIRRAPEVGAFLQCDVPVPVPTSASLTGADPVLRERLREYLQDVLTQVCRAATNP